MQRPITGLVAVFSFLCASCSHDVYIRTEPAGAQIFIDGELQGKSPLVYEESLGQSELIEVEARKEGYGTSRQSMDRSNLNTPVLLASTAGCCVGTVCCTSAASTADGEIGALVGPIGGLAFLGIPLFGDAIAR